MKTKHKSSILLIALIALMFVNVGSFTTGKRDTPKTSAAPALNVGTEQSFSFTNDSQIKAYAMNWTADKIYKLSLTNDKGCSLKAKVWYPDYKETYNMPVFYGENKYGTYLKNNEGDDFSDMGVTSSDDWNQTTENFYFKTIVNLSVIIQVYSDARNTSIAYEDLGGKVKVSDVTATFLDQSNMDITAGWSSSITNPDSPFKYKKVYINESGLYQFELNSTANRTYIVASYPDYAFISQNPLGSVLDSNTTKEKSYVDSTFFRTLPNYKKMFLPAGVVYLKAVPGNKFFHHLYNDKQCAWDLKVTSLETTIVPHNGSTSLNMKTEDSLNYTSVFFSGRRIKTEKAFIIDGLNYDNLYDYSVECPDGYNIDLWDNTQSITFSSTMENITKSGEFLVSPSALPAYKSYNGIDAFHPFRFIYGVDGNVAGDKELIDRSYSSANFIPGQVFIIPNGSTYYLLMNLEFYNTSTSFEDQSITVSVDKANTQPKVLNDASTTYNFNHISDNDAEGIYKLNTNHTGNVLGFRMTNMGDNASVTMNFLSNRYNDDLGLDLGVMDEVGFDAWYSYSWNNNTYEDIPDKYWKEVALLSDGYVILQDDTSSNSFPYQNVTTFNIGYDLFPAVNLSQEFTKQRGRDLVLLRAEMDYNTSIHVNGDPGIVDIDENYAAWDSFLGFTEDGVYQVAASRYASTEKDMTSWFASMKDTYYMPIIMNTSDGRTNIGTFTITSTGTIPDVTGLGAIPGYPIFVTLTISVFVIGIIAYLQRKRNL